MSSLQYNTDNDFEYCFTQYYLRPICEAVICIENIEVMDNIEEYVKIRKAYAVCKEKYENKRSSEPGLTAKQFFEAMMPSIEERIHTKITESINKNCITSAMKLRIDAKRQFEPALDGKYASYERSLAKTAYSPGAYRKLLEKTREIEELF